MKIGKQQLDVLWVPMLCLLLLPLSASAFYNPTAGRWLSRDPINELGLNARVHGASTFNLDEEKNLQAFVRNNSVALYDADGRAIPILVGGVAGVGTAEAVAASFGLGLFACLATPECATAVRDAIAASIARAWDSCVASRRMVTCFVRCQVVRIGAENDVIGWTEGGGMAATRQAACAAAERAARNSTAPGTRTRHCFPRN